jgi:hypothetical protein
MCCDFQDPVEMIPRLLDEWEKGYQIVCAVKTSSRENRVMYALRSLYYRILKRASRVELIEHFTGFGLYDRSFLDRMRALDDPIPFLRGVVAELGVRIKRVEYEQAARRAGETHNNLFSLYDAAMLSVTSYTRIGPRLSSFLGLLMSGGSLLGATVCLALWIFTPYSFAAGTAAVLLTLLLVGGLQLFFIGMVGEYIMAANTRLMHRPLVIEEERINFDA